MRGFRSAILDGGGIGDVVAPVVALLAFGTAFPPIAAVRFRFDEVKSSFL
jgi:ABC-2 type transport system permease protein